MKKFDKGYFYYSLVSSLGSAFVILLAFVNIASDYENGFSIPFALAAYVVIYVVQVIYSALYVRASGYILTDTELRCKRGVFFRKSSVLQYSKVHAVNKKQGLIQRIFKIATLTVDSGATSNAFSSEIVIIERTEIIDRLIIEIKQRQEGNYTAPDTVLKAKKEEEIRQNYYSFTSRLKAVYSAITVCTALLCLFVLSVVAVLLVSAGGYILKARVGLTIEDLAFGAAFLAVILMLLSSIVGLIGGILTSFIGYHDFKIYKNNDDIEVNYGLLVRHTNTFKFKRIKAIRICQGPIKKLFGFASVGLEVVGYGNNSRDNNENNNASPGVLLPLCKANEVNGLIEKILPNYTPDPVENRSRSYPAFILWPFFGITLAAVSVFAVVLTVMLMLSVKEQIIIAVALLFGLVLASVLLAVAVFCFFQYRNAGITVGEDRLTIQNGIFVKTQTVIRKKDLIAIEKITTPKRKAAGIYSYKIHFFTNAQTNTVTVKNLDKGLAAELEAFLKY